ncbi:ANTAR domain-containing protein [Amycolatopsis sp. MtRt-6]|uniref:ANTAR domain-containing protein n=1 Tax=Amycolatopsis sp. MtRt-6 TaxID=2792782 RepID=UPI0027DAC8E4|nr:ANTAR domain-containing protein [Amycolatopsis sp. MtRt-6]
MVEAEHVEQRPRSQAKFLVDERGEAAGDGEVDFAGGQTHDDSRIFVTHAAIALAGAQTEAQLHVAIEHHDVIGMAKGILMNRHDIDAMQAFRMLVAR